VKKLLVISALALAGVVTAVSHVSAQSAFFTYTGLPTTSVVAGSSFTVSVFLHFNSGGSMSNVQGLSYWMAHQNSSFAYPFSITLRDTANSVFNNRLSSSLAYPQIMDPVNRNPDGSTAFTDLGALSNGALPTGVYFIANITFNVASNAAPGTYAIGNATSATQNVGGRVSVVNDTSGFNTFPIAASPFNVTVARDTPQSGPTFVVTSLSDHYDGFCGAVDCTLVEALDAANFTAGPTPTITFAQGLTGVIVQSEADGLPVLAPVTIVGPGARLLTLDGKLVHRIFYVSDSAGEVKISGLTLFHGKPGPNESGGAIYNAATLTLVDCHLSGNHAPAFGGAIYNDGSGSPGDAGSATLTLINCSVQSNQCDLSGAGLFNAAYDGSTVTSLTNCTFYGNIATQYGGAIYNDGTSNGNAALTITNCTFSANQGNIAVSGIYNDAKNPSTTGTATVTLRNNIFRYTKSGNVNLYNDSAVPGGGSIVSEGNNLCNDAAGATGPAAAGTAPGGYLNHTGDMRNTDPGLDTFPTNNGGNTDTIALLANSLAKNNGNDALAPKLDQRGYLRLGVSDIGAYEFGGQPLRITSITRLANGHIFLQGIGVPNASHTLKVSPDLAPNSFTGPVPVTADMTGLFQYEDASAAGVPKRFYRVSFP